MNETFTASFASDSASSMLLNKTLDDLNSWLNSSPALLSDEDPILHTPAAEIHPDVFLHHSEILAKCSQVLISQLMAVKAVGIAAPQMGLPYSIMVVPVKDDASEFLVACNPRLIPSQSEKILGVEGCLSYPFFKVDVLRAKAVDVEFTDLRGNKRNGSVDGFTARVWQHEYDHLCGITMKDRVPQIRWNYAEEDAKSRKKRIMRELKNGKK